MTKPEARQIAKLKAASDRLIARHDRDVENFALGMRRVARGLRVAIIDSLTDLRQGATTVRRLVELQRSIQGQLNRLDYDGKVRNFIGKYDEAQALAVEAVEALGIASDRLAPLDEKALETLKKIDYEYLSNIGTATVREVAAGVIQNTLTGLSRSDIVDRIAGTLATNLQGRAVTYADTALVSYDRRVTWETWTAAGVSRFLYRGPKDIKNREFCAERVGKTFTMAEIDKMDNHTKLMPVWLYMGGWACRHVFSPSLEKS